MEGDSAHGQRSLNPPPAARTQSRPDLIGPWRVGRSIGKGSQGQVRLVQHIETMRYAAVKIVSRQAMIQSRVSLNTAADKQKKALLRLEREIVVMKLIDHPSVVQLYDVWETRRELFLILEYVEGGELFKELLKRKRLPLPEALHYFQQIVSAISYCHRFKIAHRDLKPENILLTAEKKIKVADFGFAVWEGYESQLETSCGSPHYVSPEILAGKPYHGALADVWSCGIILFALLTGYLPFDHPDLHVLINKVQTGSFTMPDDIPLAAQHLLRRMLEKDVDKRITTPEIIVHPFFRSSLPQTILINSLPPTIEEMGDPVRSAKDVDPEIFKNLKTLWHTSSTTEIMSGLLSPHETWEKRVYYLLLKYRARALETYNMQELQNPAVMISNENRSPEYDDKRRQPDSSLRPAAPTPRRARTPPVLGTEDKRLESDRPSIRGPEYAPVSVQSPIHSVLPPVLPLNIDSDRTRRQSRPRSSLRSTPIPESYPGEQNSSKLEIFDVDDPPAFIDHAHGPKDQSANEYETPKSPIQQLSDIDLEDPTAQRMLAQLVDYLHFKEGSSPNLDKSDPNEEAQGRGREDDTHRISLRFPVPPGMESVEVQSYDVNVDIDRKRKRHTTNGLDTSLTGLGIFNHPALEEAQDKAYMMNSFRQPTSDHPRNADSSDNEARHPHRSQVLSPESYNNPESLSDKENNTRSASRATKTRFRSKTVGAGGGEKWREALISKDEGVEVRRVLSKRRVKIISPKRPIREVHLGESSNHPGPRNLTSPPGLPGSPYLSDASSLRSPVSPYFTLHDPTPKTSWFSNIFNFKPASFSLLSVRNASSTRDECKRLLEGLSVTVDLVHATLGAGVLKCLLEENEEPQGIISKTKAVRFRVEFRPVSQSSHIAAGYTTSLILTQEKGALSTFKLVFNLLRRDWDLDTPRTPGGTSIRIVPSPILRSGDLTT